MENVPRKRGPRRAADPARERNRPLRVVVSVDERARIERSAAEAGMSVSAYLRSLGLGHLPASCFDHKAVRELGKVAGDQGRLGGLLKQWLSTRPGEGASEHNVGRLLDELLLVQSELRERVASL
jgi:hypothetical protein